MNKSSKSAGGPTRCRACGAVLNGSRLEGLCPACTWRSLTDFEGDEAESPPKAGSSKGLFHFPGYVVLEEIARGGMGIIYRARQLDPPRDVALKMLLPHQLGSTEMQERFRLEIRAIAGLEHPAILPVYQVGEHDGLPFFTMKLATGGALTQRKAGFVGKWRAIAELVATLADAIQFAHERGVLHRDLKPGNILFDEAGRAHVSDFGLAKLLEPRSAMTKSVEVLGTPQYLAPEVAGGSVRTATTASDVYGLGATLYELLAGRPPFEADGVPALLRKIAEEEPRPPSAVKSEIRNPKSEASRVPRDLEVICLKCLSKEPSARFGSARELAEDLRRWLAGRTIFARPATRLERVRAWGRRNPALAWVSALLALVLVGAVALQARANLRMQRALADSLLVQARLQRTSRKAGQRFNSLELAVRAAAARRTFWGHTTPAEKTAFRTEIAAALALPDLREVSRWPIQLTHFENEFDFTANLDRYAVTSADGGLQVLATADHKRLWRTAGTTNPAVALRSSADGRWLAGRFQNGRVELHALATNAPVRTWNGAVSPPAEFVFDKHSEKFALALNSNDGPQRVFVLNLGGGDVQTAIPLEGAATALAFDGAGRHLAVAADALEVWRLQEAVRVWSTPLTHGASVVAWSPDGRTIAAALERRLGKGDEALKADPVVLFDAVTGRQKSVFTEAGTRVERLAFHPSGDSLVAATWHGELIWGSVERDGFRLVADGAQRALTFSHDGRRLGYAPSKGELGLLEVAVPTVFRPWRMVSQPAQTTFSLAVSANGRWLAAPTSGHIHLWDAERRAEVASLPVPVTAWWVTVLFGPGDDFLYYSAGSFGVRRVALLLTKGPGGQPEMRFDHDELLSESSGWTANELAPDGRSLILGQDKRRAQNERTPPTIWLWPDGDPARARKLAENFPLVGYRILPGDRWGVSTDLVTPDVWLWNAQTGERVRSLGIPVPTSCEPTPDGRWLVTKTRAEYAVWEMNTWRQITRWPAGPADPSDWFIVSPDSHLLAATAPDGNVILRSLPGGEEIVTLKPPRAMPLAHCQFSPDGSRLFLLSSTGQMFEWDLTELRRELAKLELDWK